MESADRAIELLQARTLLLEVVGRIVRLTLHDQMAEGLALADVAQLRYRAQSSFDALAGCEDFSDALGLSLCGLSVSCVQVVEHSELSTSLARLVCVGCELLAALLNFRVGHREFAWNGTVVPYDFDWIGDTLENLSDHLDSLALEVYRGLCRLEADVIESDALPIVSDPDLDHFESYWDSLEHCQALKELSAWLLCVVFRAIGYSSVTARCLLEFTNNDLLCLCALLGGLLAARPGDGSLPQDTVQLQSVALNVLCSLTSPELAFPLGQSQEGVGIVSQNQALSVYIQTLSSAAVETGLLGAACEAALSNARDGSSEGARHCSRFLSFLATLASQPDAPDQLGPEAADGMPSARLREEIYRRVDCLGHLLEAALTVQGPCPQVELRDLVGSCATIAASVATHAQQVGEGGWLGFSDDGFTLACRMLLAACLGDDGTPDLDSSENPVALLVPLVALAANVGDAETYRGCLTERIQALRLEDRTWARAKLAPPDGAGFGLEGGRLVAALGLFDEPACSLAGAPPRADGRPPEAPAFIVAAAVVTTLVATVSAASTVGPGPSQEPSKSSGLRDVLSHAPSEFKCALDRKLLCDPVVSPAGVVFERSTLIKWLQKHSQQCPITGGALCLEDCHRSPEIRRRLAQWVREEGRQKEHRRKKRG